MRIPGREVEGNGISIDCTEAYSEFNVMLLMPYNQFFSQTKRKQNVVWRSSKCFLSPLFHSSLRHHSVGMEGLKHDSLAQFQ